MNDVAELLGRVADEAGAQARPPALAVLRRRRARRAAARAGVGATALTSVAAVGLALLPASPEPDVVVADAPPPVTAAPSEPVPAGQVALPAWAARELRLPVGAPPVAEQASSYATEHGPLVTAVRRDGDLLCRAVFTTGDPSAPSGGGGCDPVTLPAYRSARLDVGASSEGLSGSGALRWLVLHGSAPAGTRTVVVTASGGAQERLQVVGAGPEHLDRAWFALPWVQQDTVVEALDAGGRTLERSELLLGMGQPPAG